MKTYTKSAIILLAALSLTGCSKTEEFNSNPDSALEIASVSGISSYKLMSKAVITDDFLPNNESAKGIGLFVTATDGGAHDGKTEGFSNVRYTYTGEKWSTTTPVYLSKTEGKLYGYFPYSEAATKLTAIPVASSLNGTDYLYATPNDVSYSKKSVSLQMNHALARFHLTIKKGDKYLKDCKLSKILIESDAIAATGTMNIITGVVTGLKGEGTTTGSVVFDGDGVTGTVTKEGIEKDILLVPANNTIGKKDLTLTLTIDGVEAKINFSGEGGLDIRSGIQCNATIEIQDTGIKVIGVGVGLWGDGGGQTVQVNGHTVTVKLSDDAADAGIADNLIVQCKSDGESVIIESYSKNEVKHLIVRINNGSLIAPTENGSISTFTISDITKDITATLAYAKIITVKASFNADLMPNVKDYTKDFAEGEEVFIEGREHKDKVTIKVNDVAGYQFDSLVCGKTKVLANSIELKDIVNDTEVKAYYTYTDWLGGVFSVGKDTKVRFSRGNLWCAGTESNDTPAIESWGFESKQYESTPSSPGNRTISHISHFMWCKSAEESVKETYSETGTAATDNLFTNASPTEPNENFAVNGQKGFWRALSGGGSGEWKYLIDRKDSEDNALYKLGVKVCDSKNCLILLPDDWKWSENGVGDNWQDGGYPETSTEGKVTWSTMEAAGAVCLPAAGSRNGDPGYPDPLYVYDVGNDGYYWSASLDFGSFAYDLHFSSGDVNPSDSDSRRRAYSVRLVTESK